MILISALPPTLAVGVAVVHLQMLGVVDVAVPLRMQAAADGNLFEKGEFIAMLTLDVYSASTRGFGKVSAARTALHRLFAAAIVSDQFRTTLLREPEQALANGYLGQTFALSDQEKKIIKTIRAENLTDFAQKVNQALKMI
jgi:hypothetical protein